MLRQGDSSRWCSHHGANIWKKNQKDSFIPKENSFIPINETINLTFIFVVNILYPPHFNGFLHIVNGLFPPNGTSWNRKSFKPQRRFEAFPDIYKEVLCLMLSYINVFCVNINAEGTKYNTLANLSVYALISFFLFLSLTSLTFFSF